MYLRSNFVLLFFIDFPFCLLPPHSVELAISCSDKDCGLWIPTVPLYHLWVLSPLPKPSDFTRLLWGLILLMFVKCIEWRLPYSRCSVNIKHDYALFYMRWHAGCSDYSWIHCILRFQETLSIEEDTLRQRKHHRVVCLSSGRVCAEAKKALDWSVLLHLGWF